MEFLKDPRNFADWLQLRTKILELAYLVKKKLQLNYIFIHLFGLLHENARDDLANSVNWTTCIFLLQACWQKIVLSFWIFLD